MGGVSQPGSHRAFDEACIHWLRRHVLPPVFRGHRKWHSAEPPLLLPPPRKLFPSWGRKPCVHQILMSRNCSLHVGSGVVDSESTHNGGCNVGVAPLDHRKRIAPTCPVGCESDTLRAQETQTSKRQGRLATSQVSMETSTQSNADIHPRSDVSCWMAHSRVAEGGKALNRKFARREAESTKRIADQGQRGFAPSECGGIQTSIANVGAASPPSTPRQPCSIAPLDVKSKAPTPSTDNTVAPGSKSVRV